MGDILYIYIKCKVCFFLHLLRVFLRCAFFFSEMKCIFFFIPIKFNRDMILDCILFLRWNQLRVILVLHHWFSILTIGFPSFLLYSTISCEQSVYYCTNSETLSCNPFKAGKHKLHHDGLLPHMMIKRPLHKMCSTTIFVRPLLLKMVCQELIYKKMCVRVFYNHLRNSTRKKNLLCHPAHNYLSCYYLGNVQDINTKIFQPLGCAVCPPFSQKSRWHSTIPLLL